MKKLILLTALAVWRLQGAVIVADTSDFNAQSDGGIGPVDLGDATTGDRYGPTPTIGLRSLFRFDLAGLSGQTVQGALLTLTLVQTRKDQFPAPGIVSFAPPFVNPGLGDLSVVHVNDYVVPSGAAFNSASLGNDPGVLVPNGVDPNASALSIDVTAAMQQAINANFAYVTFRLQTATITDNDGLNDAWGFWSADSLEAANRPVVSYTLAAPEGAGVPEPSSFALALTGAAVAFAARRWRERMPKRSPARPR